MKKIAYYVIAVHVFLVLWSALWMPSKKVDRKPLQVRTVVHTPPVVHSAPAVVKQAVQKTAPKPQVPNPKPQTAIAKPSPPPSKPSAPTNPSTPIKPTAPTNPSAPIKPSAPSKPSSPTAKKSAPPAATAIRPAPKKNSGPVVSSELVQQLQESIAKIDQKSHKESPKEILPAPNLPTPKWVPQLKIDEESGGEESLFVTTLVQCLQEALNLPEVGEVKVELTLKRDGSFVQMKVLRSESERNKKFLEQELKKLTFPPFDGNLKNEKEHAFIITFCNS